MKFETGQIHFFSDAFPTVAADGICLQYAPNHEQQYAQDSEHCKGQWITHLEEQTPEIKAASAT